MNNKENIQLDIVEGNVHNHYSALAKEIMAGNNSSCCGSDKVTENIREIPSFGSDKDLLGRAELSSGEVVVDFGSGPGHDLMKIARIVAPGGEAIGVDFSEDMVQLAQKNAAEEGINNVKFVQSDLTSIPLPDELADMVTSNCVFNLIGDKRRVFEEAYRILQPRGRFIISDQITHIDSNTEISDTMKCGCLGGATSIEEYLEYMEEVGFEDVTYDVEFENTVSLADQEIKYSSVLFFGNKP